MATNLYLARLVLLGKSLAKISDIVRVKSEMFQNRNFHIIFVFILANIEGEGYMGAMDAVGSELDGARHRSIIHLEYAKFYSYYYTITSSVKYNFLSFLFLDEHLAVVHCNSFTVFFFFYSLNFLLAPLDLPLYVL